MVFNEKGNAAADEKERSGLPCAGITLIRFYGYDLSFLLPAPAKCGGGKGRHPGFQCRKIREK
jgi:hypothetical protein